MSFAQHRFLIQQMNKEYVHTISVEDFYSQWDTARVIHSTDLSAIKKLFEPFIKVIDKTSLGVYYWQIFDNAKQQVRIIEVGGAVESMLPVNANTLINLEVSDFFAFFHPDDLQSTLSFVKKVFEMMLKTESSQRQYFNFQIFARIRNIQNQYRWNCIQYPALYFDETGHLLYGLVLYTDIHHLMKPDARPMLTVINSAEVTTHYSVCYKSDETIASIEKHPILTLREREVIALLAQGKASKQIADILGIAKNTVDNHRQRLLKKFGVSSSSELVVKAIIRH
jgi:DNA-binding CsgD family transcriptional regulator